MTDVAIVAPIDVSIARELGVPRLDAYFGMWAVHEDTFRALVERAAGVDLRAHIEHEKEAARQVAADDLAADRVASETVQQRTREGVAVIDLTGTLMKSVGSLSAGTSTVFARRLVRAAVADDDVRAILLRIDSPGGTVAGTAELADDVAAANKRKPVYAFIEDLGASAAYWVAAQAGTIFANRMALVGSIGTYVVLQDLSGMAAKEGIKVHVIKAGEFKGAGVPGTEITAGQLAEVQRLINERNEHFLAAVASGRRMSLADVREMADGRVHTAAMSATMRLIDGVKTFDEAFAAARRSGLGGARAETPGMEPASQAQEPEMANEQKAATLAELESACPGASSDFLMESLKKGRTVAEATAAHITALNEGLAKAKQDAEAQARRAEEAIASAKASSTAPRGLPPLGSTTKAAEADEGGDAFAKWNAAVAAAMPRCGNNKARAIAKVVAEQPELHAAFVEAYNAEHAPRRPTRRSA